MSIVSHGSAHRPAKLITPSVDDIVEMFLQRNAGRRDLSARARQLTPLVEGFLGQVAALLNDWPEAVDLDVGEGLHPPLSAGEGARRLAAYATPMRLEDWAGEVAGSSELAMRHSISRSTLHDWQKRGAVIGLLAGSRKHVFPLAQFIDGRPVEGLGAITAAAGAPRTAWLWLVEPHPSLGGRRPIDRLRSGAHAEVIDLAERDFGQS